MCWGRNGYGELGYGHTTTIGTAGAPVLAAGFVNAGGAVIVQLAVGGEHTCGLTANGSVMCWGWNQFGQLGYGHINNVGDTQAPFTAGFVNTGGVSATTITAGYSFTCIVTLIGSVMCWGDNSYGQLGYGHVNAIGDDELPFTAGQVPIGEGLVVTQLVSSNAARHICAMVTNGSVLCWGGNDQGQLGYGHTDNIGDDEFPSAAGFVGGADLTFVDVSVGQLHTCATFNANLNRNAKYVIYYFEDGEY
jgi:alpha-tubulin suppressor-like RCC1 family protein